MPRREPMGWPAFVFVVLAGLAVTAMSDAMVDFFAVFGDGRLLANIVLALFWSALAAAAALKLVARSIRRSA